MFSIFITYNNLNRLHQPHKYKYYFVCLYKMMYKLIHVAYLLSSNVIKKILLPRRKLMIKD